MNDPYVWLDPFEERDRAERAERRAATAYRDGQRAVLRDVAGPQREKFDRVLDMAVRQSAEAIARQKIAPHMAKSYEEAREREYRMEREVPEIERYASPLVAGLRSHGRFDLDVSPLSVDDATYTMKYEVAEPFQFNVSMSPLAWR